MEIRLSPQENNPFTETVFVILCAGKGTRLRHLTKDKPKPLINLKQVGKIPILQYTLKNLLKLNPKNIIIITGYLGTQIEQFIQQFKNIHQNAKNKISIINASKRYELGPLYSFMTLVKCDQLFTKESNYCVLPGDTIFDFSTLSSLQKSIAAHIKTNPHLPLILYRKITINKLNREYTKENKLQIRKLISFIDIDQRSPKGSYLGKIQKKDIQNMDETALIRQIIPLFYFPYDFIIKLQKAMPHSSASRLTGLINILIEEKNEIILAKKIPSTIKFYDIDTKYDLQRVKMKKKRRQ